MRSLGEYGSFIFDLYGTLIDVHTDEGSPALWAKLSEWYAVFGADYEPRELGEKYRAAVAEAERALGEASGCPLPEIKLEDVFIRLLKDAPGRRAALSPEGRLDTWAADTANVFRILSRDRLNPYPGAAELLKYLKNTGKRTFLLSNAQAVFTVPEIEACALDGLFDGVYLSSEHGMKKPHPEFMESLLREYGINREDAVMVGNDWYSDVAVAAACGVAAAWVNTDRRSEYEKEYSRGMIREKYPDARVAEFESVSDLFDVLRGAL